MTALPPSPFLFTPAPVLHPGVNAAAASPPAPVAAAASNSRDCALRSPASPRAAGMSRVEANAGGEHEEVARRPENTALEKKAATAFETTSLAARAAIDERKDSGTAPGACGPERDIFGALNSDPVHHPEILPASETSAHASASPLFSSSGFGPVDDTLAGWRENRFSEKLPAESTGSAQAGASFPFKATDSRTNFDPGMSGFGIDFEYEVAALEAQWARDGIIMNATTFFTEAANSIPPASSSSA